MLHNFKKASNGVKIKNNVPRLGKNNNGEHTNNVENIIFFNGDFC